MTYHIWGDNWPHWNELYEAENWISAYVYRYSRCRLQSKEKYGTIRYEYVWPPAYHRNGPIIQLPYPLFYRTIMGQKYPRYLLFWTSSWLYRKWMWYGDKILGRAVRKACRKFPNVANELVDDLQWR